MNYLIRYFTVLDFKRTKPLLTQTLAAGYHDNLAVIPRERCFVFIDGKQFVCSSIEYHLRPSGGEVNVILFDPVEVEEMHKNAKKTDAAKKRPKRKRVAMSYGDTLIDTK